MRRCIPEKLRCDKIVDCLGGEDEINCPKIDNMARRNQYSLYFNDTLTAKLLREDSIYLYNQHILNNAYKSEHIDEIGSGDVENVDSNNDNVNHIDNFPHKNLSDNDSKNQPENDDHQITDKNEGDTNLNDTFSREAENDNDQISNFDQNKNSTDFESDIFVQASQNTSENVPDISGMTEKNVGSTGDITLSKSGFNSEYQPESSNRQLFDSNEDNTNLDDTLSPEIENKNDDVINLNENGANFEKNFFLQAIQNSTEKNSDMVEKIFDSIESSTSEFELNSEHLSENSDHQIEDIKENDTNLGDALFRETENNNDQSTNLNENDTNIGSDGVLQSTQNSIKSIQNISAVTEVNSDSKENSTPDEFEFDSEHKIEINDSQISNKIEDTDKNEDGTNLGGSQSRQADNNDDQITNLNENSSNFEDDLSQLERGDSTGNFQNITTKAMFETTNNNTFNFSKSFDTLPSKFQNNTFVDIKNFSNPSLINSDEQASNFSMWNKDTEKIPQNFSADTKIEFSTKTTVPLIVQPGDTFDDTDMETSTFNSNFNVINEISRPDTSINELQSDKTSSGNFKEIDINFENANSEIDLIKSTTLSSDTFKNNFSTSNTESSSFDISNSFSSTFETSTNRKFIEGKELNPIFENSPTDSHINKKELEEAAWSGNGNELFKKIDIGWSNNSVPMKQTFKPTNSVNFDCKRY